MKKVLSALAVLVAAGFLFAATAPDKVTIDGAKNKKPAVEFPHKVHADLYKCKQCHHTWDGKGTPAKCTSCHTLKGKDKAPKAYIAFHHKTAKERSCTACHKDLKKAGKKTGPTKCGDCHKK